MPGAWQQITLKEGVQLSDNNSGDVVAPGTSAFTDIAGTPSDLWGITLDEAKVEATAFGVGFSCKGPLSGDDVTFGIDAVRMKVYYTVSDLVEATGTVVGATETQIAGGGRTIILDLTGVTWLASGSAFDGSRQAIIDGLDSAQSETLGWNAKIRDTLGVGQVVRTSSTRVTITLLAAETGDYKIVVDEVLTATMPASVHSGSITLTDNNFATITAECDQTLAPDSIATQTNLSGAVTDIDESVDSPDANWLVLAA